MNERQVQEANEQVKQRQKVAAEGAKISTVSPPRLDMATEPCLKCEKGWTAKALVDGVCPDCRDTTFSPRDKAIAETRWSTFCPKRYLDAKIEHLEPLTRKVWETLPDDMGIMLWGTVGAGKSYAMIAFARELILKKGMEVTRTTYNELYRSVKSSYDRAATETEEGAIARYRRCEVLIIEDVGLREDEPEKSFEIFMAIINHRYENLKLTFLTSNKPIQMLTESFSQQVESRIHEMCIPVKMSGDDRRKP